MKRLLLIPRVAALGARAPRNPTAGWNRYWHNIRSTGHGGDVLWDDADTEMPGHLDVIGRYLDPLLPVVDIGCGNGRFTRLLAPHFPTVVGVDVSADAISRARDESAATPGVTFRTLDATLPDAGLVLREEFGESNVFVRGVFHVLDPAAQVAMAESMRVLLGERGTLFLAETNFLGGDLAYLVHLGASARHIPMPLRRAIGNLPRPGHFGAAEREHTFGARTWRLLEDGATVIHTVPLRGGSETERIPGYFAVLMTR